MTVGRYYRKKQLKRQYEQSLCRCVVAVFQVAVFCQSVSSITAQGFMQSSVEADGIIQRSTLFTQSEIDNAGSQAFQIDPKKRVTSQADVIRFDPPFLDFDVQPIGIPSTRIVYVYNPSKTKSLRLNAISARTSHFHSSFFDKKFVPPGANASYEVVFLARIVGNVENTLFINTAVGTFSYQVFGVGAPNPYRLRPFLGAKVSINSTFSSVISIHNPTGTPLQVTEMYTSSGFLHLQLPSGMDKGIKQLWEIPPYETRPVMQASFMGQVADNHTAFIRIKTNRTDFAQNVIVPLEVEVTTAPGIYSSLEMLDFGTLRSKDQPKTLNLFLLNSGSKEVQIGSVAVQPPNPALKIKFKSIRLEPSDSMFTSVANISFDVKKVRHEDQWSGKIVIRSKEKSYAELALSYQVNILNGNLGFDDSCIFFHVPPRNESRSKAQNITITNTFDFPVILHRLELPESTSSYFRVVNFTSPCSIPAQSTGSCFSIECLALSFQSLNTEKIDSLNSMHHVILHTNASAFSMPLHAFSGLLTFKVQNGNLASLDFGIMGTLDKRQMLLSLFNHNPVEVSLFDFNSSLLGVDVNVISLTRNDIAVKSIVRSLSRNILLPPGSRLTLEVVLTAPATEQLLSGNITFLTSYEKFEIPVKARIAIGSLTLKPSHFKFPPTFPGMLVFHTLSVTSSFAQTMKIESLTCEDKRFYYRKHKNIGSELEPGKELRIGKVYFDARLNCKPGRCYVGLPTSTTVGHHWLSTLSLGKNAAEVDTKLYKSHQDQWKKLKEQNLTSISRKFQLTTNLVRSFDIDAAVSLYWPSLVDEPVYELPLTHIGKQSVISVTLHNPSDLPVIVQILPISLYPHPHSALDALGKAHLLEEEEEFITSNASVFNVSLSPNSSSQDTSQMMWLEYTLNGKTNKSCVNLFLNPNQRRSVDISFHPLNNSVASTLILIRNNLTILESFKVRGRGVMETLKLGGKLSSEPNSSLKFKLTKSLLRDCFNSRKDTLSPSYTVRKSFIAKNLGLLRLQVRHMMIDNYPCEGYGFRILDCQSFALQPNETKDITIVYTPDFTISQVSHTLRIFTSQGNLLTFNLNVTLPHHLLPLCQNSIPRPDWESLLYYCFVALTIIGFIGIVSIAYLEAMTKLQPYIKNDNSPGKPFNLQEIAANLGNMNGNGNGFVAPRRYRRKAHRVFGFDFTSVVDTLSDFTSKYLTFDITAFLQRPNIAKQTDVESRRSSITEVFESDERTKRTPVSPSHNSTNNRTRNRQNRKSKSSNSSPNQNPHNVKTKNQLVEEPKPPVFAPPLSWTIISASESTTNNANKINDDDKTDTASASSVESSRSRGSSVSSGNNENFRRRDNEGEEVKTATKRKRKNTRQFSFLRDTDESSTTTEKSSEDFDVKPTLSEHTSKRGYKAKPNNYRTGYDSEYKEAYNRTPPHEVALRHRRGVRINPSPPKSESTICKPKFHHKPAVYTHYDPPTTTDEPIWDFPKVIINKQEADERLQTLSEKTRQLDLKIRSSPQNTTRPVHLSNHTQSFCVAPSLTTEGFQTLITNPSPSFVKPKKAGITKAQSMPEKASPPRFYPPSDAPLPLNRRQSNNDNYGSLPFSENGNSLSTFSPTSPTTTIPAWTNFGQNYDSFMTHTTSVISPPPRDTGSSHWPMYNSPHPTSWTPDNPFQISAPHSPRSPVSSQLLPPTSVRNESNVWDSNPPPTPRSTHAIWSVRNAVTMDEDRNTAESDPLGLKSIWNQNSFDGRNKFF